MVDTVILDAIVRRFPILIAAARRYGTDHELVHTYAKSQGAPIISAYETAVQIAALFPNLNDRR